jgi:hypothetical protein
LASLVSLVLFAHRTAPKKTRGVKKITVTILSQTGRILFCPLLGAMPDSGRALMYQNPLIINLIGTSLF